jgi:hypothetical protein
MYGNMAIDVPKYSSGEEMLGLGCFGSGTSSGCEIGKSKIYLPFLKLLLP